MTPRVAVVVGGTRRVGRWASEALLVGGHRVHAIYLRDAAAAETCVAEMRQAGMAFAAHQADITVEEEARQVLATVAADEGRIDTLIYAPGMGGQGAVVAASADELEQLWRSNVLGAHNAVTAAIPYLRLAGREAGGRVMFFLSAGSDSGKAFRSVPLYAACKAMLLSYARSLARELAGAGITVNCIALGITTLPAEDVPPFDSSTLPSGRAVGQDDLAAALWYLTGHNSEQLTGAVLNLGGGFGL